MWIPVKPNWQNWIAAMIRIVKIAKSNEYLNKLFQSLLTWYWDSYDPTQQDVFECFVVYSFRLYHSNCHHSSNLKKRSQLIFYSFNIWISPCTVWKTRGIQASSRPILWWLFRIQLQSQMPGWSWQYPSRQCWWLAFQASTVQCTCKEILLGNTRKACPFVRIAGHGFQGERLWQVVQLRC